MPSAKDMIKTAKEAATYAALEAATAGAISESSWEQIFANRSGITLEKMDAALTALGLRLVRADAIVLPPEDYIALVRGGKRLFRILEILHEKGIVLKDIE